MNSLALTPGSIANLACCLEVAAPKPGNVHRGADFDDLIFEDFLVSATLLGQTIDQFKTASVGETVLAVVQNTRDFVGTNTNLGIALLIVPLAKGIQWFSSISSSPLTTEGLKEVFDSLTLKDGELIYEAIRLANPTGLGASETADVNRPFPDHLTLIEAMSLAADRDLIARQYANCFQEVFGLAVPSLVRGQRQFGKLNQAIVFAHLSVMAEHPDSLIIRKCGLPEALLAQSLARKCIEPLPSESELCDLSDGSIVKDLDFWLRANGHQRNPGSTADLIAASLFVAIYNREITAPYR